MKKGHHRSALVDVKYDELRPGDHVTYTAEHDACGKGLWTTVVHRARE